MAKKLLGPWGVLYPVRFYSGGDTTAEAFGKHIDEIKTIYGILNALDNGKIGVDELNELIVNIQTLLKNQKHNELKDIQGGDANNRWHLTAAQVAKLDGAASASDVIKNHNSLQGLQGGDANNRYHLTAAQVAKLDGAASSGDIVTNHNSLQNIQGGSQNERFHLTQAQLNGLTNLISNPPSVFKKSYFAANGYVQFDNGFMIQWGATMTHTDSTDETAQTAYFPTAFNEACYQVIMGTGAPEADYSDFFYQLIGRPTKTGFTWARQHPVYGPKGGKTSTGYWIAVGK